MGDTTSLSFEIFLWLQCLRGDEICIHVYLPPHQGGNCISLFQTSQESQSMTLFTSPPAAFSISHIFSGVLNGNISSNPRTALASTPKSSRSSRQSSSASLQCSLSGPPSWSHRCLSCLISLWRCSSFHLFLSDCIQRGKQEVFIELWSHHATYNEP